MIAALLVTTLFTTAVMAEEKIGILDFERAIFSSDIAQEQIKRFSENAEVVANRKELESLQKEGQELYEKLQKDKDVMSKEQQAELNQKMQSKQTAIQAIVKRLSSAEKQLKQAIIRDLSTVAQKAATDVIKEEKIDLLLNSNAVMFENGSFSITDKVIEQLNTLEAEMTENAEE